MQKEMTRKAKDELSYTFPFPYWSENYEHGKHIEKALINTVAIILAETLTGYRLENWV
jgi:hypothetical protein